MSAILHLDTEAARATSKAMYGEFGNIMDAKWHVKKETDDFLYKGGWTGPSHDEFVGLWEEWDMLMNSVIRDLAILQDNLEMEVNKWEMATERFAYLTD